MKQNVTQKSQIDTKLTSSILVWGLTESFLWIIGTNSFAKFMPVVKPRNIGGSQDVSASTFYRLRCRLNAVDSKYMVCELGIPIIQSITINIISIRNYNLSHRVPLTPIVRLTFTNRWTEPPCSEPRLIAVNNC